MQQTDIQKESINNMVRKLLHLKSDIAKKDKAINALAMAYSFIIDNDLAGEFESWLPTVIEEPYLLFASYSIEALSGKEVTQ